MKERRASVILGLSVLALTGNSAYAQSATGSAEAPADEGPRLQEIVVTAQKRAENLQTVPISVTAVDSGTVEDLHALTIQGLQGKVPNVQIDNFSNTPNTAVFTIRGIGVIEPDPYAGNTVSIVVDGIPQYFSMGALVDLFDIDRIEVLRGPQGTLFGANTTGGVINIVTRQPTSELNGNAEATYGNYGRLDLKGAFGGALGSDALLGKIAVSHHELDGYTRNVVDGKMTGERDVTLARGYLKYAGAEHFDATLIGEYDRARNGAPIFINGSVAGEAVYLASGTLAPGATLPMYRSPCEPVGSRCHAPNKYQTGRQADTPNVSDMDTYRGTLTMNWTDTAIGDITSITGYKKFKLLEYTDQDGTPVFLADSRRYTKGWQLSEELRTAVDLTDSIKMIAGGFYMKTHYDHQQDYRIQFAAPGLIQSGLQDQDNYSISAFAQTYIDLTDKLRAQAGVRYTHEKTQMLASTVTSINLSGTSRFDGVGNVLINSVAPPEGSKSWNNTGWKLGLDYQAMDDTLLYGYWSRGFKSGGFTGRLGLASDLGPYGPEKVDTFEAGLKADLFDRRVRLNISGFYTNYRNMQIASIYFTEDAQGTIVQGNSILNAAKAEIKGVEVEGTVLVADGLTLNGSLAYLDTKYKSFDYFDNAIGAFRDLSGYELQNAPKWSATAGARYEFMVAGAEVTANVSYSYVSSKFLTAISNTPRSEIQPTHLVDANVDVDLNDHWTIEVWARNLLDNRYMASLYDAPGIEGLAAYAPPRMYGVTVKTKW